MALAISALLAALKVENGQDYVYACFFLISVRCSAPLMASMQIPFAGQGLAPGLWYLVSLCSADVCLAFLHIRCFPDMTAALPRRPSTT